MREPQINNDVSPSPNSTRLLYAKKLSKIDFLEYINWEIRSLIVVHISVLPAPFRCQFVWKENDTEILVAYVRVTRVPIVPHQWF